MSLARRFAQVFGVVYPLLGVAGFVPPFLIGNVSGVTGPLAGFFGRPPAFPRARISAARAKS